MVPFRFDSQRRIGTLLVAAARNDFPTEIEMLVLRIAVTQAATALHEAQCVLAAPELADVIDRLTQASWVMSMGELTTSIAHEISQPLTGVIANSNACLRWLNRPVPDLQEVREAAEHIIRDVNRANEVVRSIQAFSKKAPMHKCVLDINAIISEVLSMLEGQLRSSRIETTLALSAHPMWVPVDRAQLRQVLVHLVVNAIEALRPLTGRPRRLRICSRRDVEDHVTVRVEDEGIGPGEQAMNRLFDPFFTTKPDGMGLGLSISRGIIQAHGGVLNADRNHPHGLAMTFSLPAHSQMP